MRVPMTSCANASRSRTARTTSSAAKRAGLAFERGFF